MKRYSYLLGQTDLFEHFLTIKVRRPSSPPRPSRTVLLELATDGYPTSTHRR